MSSLPAIDFVIRRWQAGLPAMHAPVAQWIDLPAIQAPLAQMDGASGSEPEGREFKSHKGHCRRGTRFRILRLEVRILSGAHFVSRRHQSAEGTGREASMYSNPAENTSYLCCFPAISPSFACAKAHAI